MAENRIEEAQIKRRQQRQPCQTKTNQLVINKSIGIHEGQKAVNKYEQTENHNNDDEEEEDEEDEEKGSCNSSNAPYPAMQMEQEESYSLPSTSSTNSDKQPTQVANIPASKEVSRSIEEDGDPVVSTSLARNSTVLLQLIACGGGGTVGPQSKMKIKAKDKNKDKEKANNFNFSMKNTFIPCLKHQLSTRNNAIPQRVKPVERQPPCSNYCKAGDHDHDDRVVVSKEYEDEDMMMVRYMSENPRFGNLQSQDKEYFSGTIVEAMSTHHLHTHSSSSCSHLHPPVFTKSSSYNEQRSSKAGLQAEAEAASSVVDMDDEKEDAKVKGIIKLCMPRKKSFSSTSTKHS
ncbi:hypothetical protein SOVF_215800 [Spinacia oleracea]|nr:hypothetical protein SOVF_215800 [Spinacia oleracea]